MEYQHVEINLEEQSVLYGHCWSSKGSRTDSPFPFRKSAASIEGSQTELSRNCAGDGLRRSNEPPMGGGGDVSLHFTFTQAHVAA